ncbi:MAG: DUF1559 domain-containing protein [Pirellulaceae bacterium]
MVDQQFAAHAGACVECGKPITVPEFHENDTIVQAKQTHVGNNRMLRKIALGCIAAALVATGGYVLFQYGLAGALRIQANTIRGACRNNARQIAAALNAYADDYGTYPTPTVTDSAGQPMYSWRVLLLPYLGQERLYEQFNLNEPWNSPQNLQLMYNRPSEYGSPAAGGNAWSEPNYMLITGPGTLFPSSGPRKPNDVLDRPEQTLLVVEVARPMGSNELAWTQPGDLDVTAMVPAINGKDGVEIGGNHEGGATAATCDGRDHFLPTSLSPGEIRALITPAGGEPLRDDLLDIWE